MPAKPISREFASLSQARAASYGGIDEEFVWLRYKVGVDGKTGYFSGPARGIQRFADLTIEQVKGWTFEPATMNGKPVEESGFGTNLRSGCQRR